ncbi:MAG: DNA polymerase III subunit delta' [Wenzhouxiangella sp.]
MNLPWLSSLQQHFETALTAGRLGHAPMIQGPSGLGKRQLARWLTARLLCLMPIDGLPCGQCRSCQLLDSGSHPDLFVAKVPEDKTQLTVDVIRDLTRGLQLTPAIGPHRVGLVEEADRMNRNAANALLKTLEEPSDQAWLILVSDDPAGLPATVLSRCQRTSVHPPDAEIARSWLEGQVETAGRDDIELAQQASGGAPLRALALLTSDGLDFGRQVRGVMLDAARGQLPAPGLIDDWAGRAPESWHWLAYWCRSFMGSLLLDDDRALTVEPVGLGVLWQQALAGRAMAGTSIRADLLLSKWLLEWSGLFARTG